MESIHPLRLTLRLCDTVAIVSLILLAYGCSTLPPSGNTNPIAIASPVVEPNPFAEALVLAGQASQQGKTARTRPEWKGVATRWERAIARMKAVPESSPNYATAQEKVLSYQPNLDYVRQRAEDPLPEAYDAAVQANNLTKKATSQQDWDTVASHWQRSLKLLEIVPETASNYTLAQQKIAEYRANLTHARGQAIDALVRDGSSLLDAETATWANPVEARKIYDALKAADAKLVTQALVRQVRDRGGRRMQVLLLSVKLGIPGSEDALNRVLVNYGDQSMAEDFLNSGSPQLYEGGRQWAAARGYEILTGPGSHRTGWGSF